MKNIAFDVMGNDNGPKFAVAAAKNFVSKNPNFKIFLVGNKEQMGDVKENENIKIIDVREEIDPSKGVLAARDSNTSMAQAVKMVKDGIADAIISSGDSGSLLSISVLQLKRIKGISRPAFMPILPTIKGDNKTLLLDAGANLVTTSEMLVQWAHIASIYASEVFGIKKPKVGIINIGSEDKKGNDFQKEANEKLKNSKLIYKGFIESRDLLNSIVDVAVVDGYAGNMVLKTMEGTALSLFKVLKDELTSSLKNKIGALLSKSAYKNVKKRLDYRNIGAALIIGLNGIAIKTHGNSDEMAYMGALNQIKLAIENDVINKIKGVV